ncbi:MAG: HD domain-containing phosphohydrolase [Rickettsiales bacterium]|nr:HD domain-containing phosphohydrolase [Rickettsiales bacterium]
MPKNLHELNEIGIALSAEHNIERLLEMILEKAKQIANADAGILFTKHELEEAYIQRVRHCDTLNIHVGGTTGEPTYGYPIELQNANGKPHTSSVTAACAMTRESINIENIQDHPEFDFSSTKDFDKRRGYETKSVLAVPMITKRKEVIGVIRLSNAQNEKGEISTFSAETQHMVESLASQAAIALDNDLLIQGLEDLLESFIQLVAKAIDNKSAHTGNHLQRIPIIVEMLAKAANDSKHQAFKDFNLNETEMYELRIAAWLHDCGKLSTPDYILEKGTKLATFHDRIQVIGTRLEVLLRDLEIAHLKDEIDGATHAKQIMRIKDDWQFLQELNLGREWVPNEEITRLNKIAEYSWAPQLDNSEKRPFFSDDELENLSVQCGTLTTGDRKIIQDHILHSIDMLERMPFPKQLRRVPEYAGAHHERMDGKGYPNGLTGDQMSIPARMMAVADVFEALTSHDRPYKTPKTLTESREIMTQMRNNGGLDPDIFDLLWDGSDVVNKYSDRFLNEEQKV